MTRIIAGSARGRRLEVPAAGTRPTADRVREAMFSSLQALLSVNGIPWSQTHVLDGYSGSGALGLEALSRGAASVLLIENRSAACSVIQRNIEVLGLPGARVTTASLATVAARKHRGDQYGLVLLDPPYEVSAGTIAAELAVLAEHGWLADDAVIMVERPRNQPEAPLPADCDLLRSRAYGDTVLWYGQWVPGRGASTTESSTMSMEARNA